MFIILVLVHPRRVWGHFVPYPTSTLATVPFKVSKRPSVAIVAPQQRRKGHLVSEKSIFLMILLEFFDFQSYKEFFEAFMELESVRKNAAQNPKLRDFVPL